MTFESLHVPADDDTKLATYRWRASTRPRAIVVLVHGMAEHARRYDAFAQQLSTDGIDVHAFDLRGHGATTRALDHGYMGPAMTWSRLVDDVAHIRAHALAVAGALPVFVFGHSLGSFLVQRVLQQRGNDYAGAILSGTDNPNRIMCRFGAIVAAIESSRVDATGTSSLLQRMTLGAYDRRLKKKLGARLRPNAWITSHDAALDAYQADPDCGFALRTQTWRRVLNGIACTNAPHARRAVPAMLPILLVAGRDDPMGRFGRGPTELARALDNDGQRDIELYLYAGARHEVLHEHVADQAAHDIRTWIGRHTS